ncbi:MAG: DinB family protein [candidate division Zixibacteria bacterium]|nr:DinB family protein [candidate division Zixibacteria bacterium]
MPSSDGLAKRCRVSRCARNHDLQDFKGVYINLIKFPEGYPPAIGKYLYMMEDVRERTLNYIQGLTVEQLSWHPNPRVESIGTLLLHIAAIEFSYIQEDIMQREMGEEWKIAFPIRFNIPQISGKELDYFVDKLNEVRNETKAILKTLTDEDLNREITLHDSGDSPTKFSIEWILYHLVEHEAHHKGQIAVMKRLLKK